MAQRDKQALVADIERQHGGRWSSEPRLLARLQSELVRIVWCAENRRAVVIARLGVDHGVSELQGVGAIAKQSAFDSSLDWRSYSSVTQVPV